MADDLAASKETCQEAQNDEQSGDPESAQIAWNTLSQIVHQVDIPYWRNILRAVEDARSGLEDLESTFSKVWRGQDHKVNTLKLGVAKAKHGIDLFLAAIRKLEGAFNAWDQHDCASAQQAIDRANEHTPPAVKRINDGMHLLKSLR